MAVEETLVVVEEEEEAEGVEVRHLFEYIYIIIHEKWFVFSLSMLFTERISNAS